MKKSISSVEHVARIAAGKENARKIPKEFIRIYEARFEGLRLPKEPSQKRDFLRSVIDINDNVLIETKDIGRLISDENVTRLWLDNIISVLEICELACKFSDPNRYARFLARPGLRVLGMLHSMPGFAAGREITFEEVPEDRRLMGRHIFEIYMGRTTEGSGLLKELICAYMEIAASRLAKISTENRDPYDKFLLDVAQNGNVRVVHFLLKIILEQ